VAGVIPRPPGRGIDRRAAVWSAAGLLLFAPQVSALWYSAPDSARYLSIARRIAAGTGVADLDNPVPVFPPGYPALVSPAFWWSPRPFLAISLIHLAVVAALAALTYRWMARCLGPGAHLATALVLANASLWLHVRTPLSELAFMTAAMATVEHLDALRHAGPAGPGTRRRLVGAATWLALLPLLREVGVVFALGFAARSAVDARRGHLPPSTPPRVVVALTLAGVLSLGVFLTATQVAAARAPVPVATHLRGLLQPPVPRAQWVAQAARARVSDVGRLLVPGSLREPPLRLDWRLLVYVPLTLLVAGGWWRLAATGDLLAATSSLYLLVYLAWGFEASTRYLLPLLPLLIAALWLALERLGRARGPLVAALVGLHLLASVYDWQVHDRPRARACAAEWPIVDAVAALVPSDALLGVGAGVPGCLETMLAFARDRGSAYAPFLPGLFERADWRLEPRPAHPPPGFVPVADAGSYRLVRRLGRGAAADQEGREEPVRPPAALR
jgi:hypothetical protein